MKIVYYTRASFFYSLVDAWLNSAFIVYFIHKKRNFICTLYRELVSCQKISLNNSRVTWSITSGKMSSIDETIKSDASKFRMAILTFQKLDILLHLLNWIFCRWILCRCLFWNWILCVGYFVVVYSVGIPLLKCLCSFKG